MTSDEAASAARDARARIESIRAELHDAGFMIRLTEWSEGFQAGAVLRSDTRVAFFSGWRRGELEAWEEVLSLVDAWRRRA